MIEGQIERGWRGRVGQALDRAEHVYLRILRAVILVIATVMILFAAWLAITSIYKMSRSPDSVVEQPASVKASELVDAEAKAPSSQPRADKKPAATPEQQRFYKDFVDRYYKLFKARFEPYRQAEDKMLSRDEFDDNFVGSQSRLTEVANGERDFVRDSGDLRDLLVVMTQASHDPKTLARLKKYQVARKVPVQQKVQRTRTEMRRGWDSYSTACSGWYYSPVGCPTQRAVEVPYTETVTTMEFPEGTQSHTQLFSAFQDRYFNLLGSRREANANAADRERGEIVAGKAEGAVSMMTAAQILGAFLVLMFFFLLIAIERHQRRMSSALVSDA